MRMIILAVAASIIFPGLLHAQRRGSASTLSPEVLQAQQEQADFTELLGVPAIDAKIKLCEQFLKNYPKSTRTEVVYNQLVTDYYTKQDWDNFYATADRTIASYPDDYDVLTLVGWVIPHKYDPYGADADKKLDKAEDYEKHAIELIPAAVRKAPNVTDGQFAAAKSEKLSQAHSGLGLVYFRKQNWEGAVGELQQATQTAQSADATDLYALAVSLQHLDRNVEAANTFDKCSGVYSTLQSRCKEAADNARTQALQSK